MKLKFLLANLIVVLLMSACARETYYFPKVGDPYGSYHKKVTPAPAATPENVITAAEMVAEPTPDKEEAVITALANRAAVAT
ncbi:MAG: hypothetical protein M3142_06175, partial [Bacteroidota bacterium]|nr:hypothetical protein [Bacteroidota bacterium]